MAPAASKAAAQVPLMISPREKAFSPVLEDFSSRGGRDPSPMATLADDMPLTARVGFLPDEGGTIVEEQA